MSQHSLTPIEKATLRILAARLSRGGRLRRACLRELSTSLPDQPSVRMVCDALLGLIKKQVMSGEAGWTAFHNIEPLVNWTEELMMTKVFVVHGHDARRKSEVARVLEKLGLEAIILHEQPSGGAISLIEKIERYSDVKYAVVILTADDLGCKKGDTVQKPRARQNVVLELGYFLGCLGRRNVHALYETGVELPSDYHGVLYTQFDVPGEDWRQKLAKELKDAKLPVDLNQL